MILLLHVVFYPALTPYRAGLHIARHAEEHGIQPLATYRWSSHELDFALRRRVPVFEQAEPMINWTIRQLNNGADAVWWAVPRNVWTTQKLPFENIFLIQDTLTFPYFRVAVLNTSFLNPFIRNNILSWIEIISVTRETER